MSDNLGTGVSRVLAVDGAQYDMAIWQQGKPPTDAALNLMQQLAGGAVRSATLRGMPSGFLGNETNLKADFVTNSTWSNWFKFGPQLPGETSSVMWANVAGYLIPVTGTRTGTPPGSPDDTDTSNVVALDPPPSNSGDFRIDFVFLEVWKARIQPNPSTTNKPAAASVYKYGNVEGGYSFLTDDLVDPALGFETEQRVQVQYRIRVVPGLVGLTTNPDGFDPVVVKAQGAASAATSYTFTNMREELGDPGLWRAGDGTDNSLGTVDGYSYAIPISAVFRRNSVSWNGNPSQNLNGAFNRNPTAVDRTGIQTFSTVPSLAADITSAATTATLASVSNIPLPLSPASAVTIQIGDEIMTYTSITGTTLNGLSRGQNGTLAEAHSTGDEVRVISGRPDGLFSDQIARTDILDLRHVVNPNGADYSALLKANLDQLLRGQLRANWKRSGAGPQGVFVHYQDAIQSAAVSLGVTQLDAPDNIRMVYSDAATIQPVEVVVLPNSGVVPPGPGVDINVAWSLSITAQTTNQTVANQFTAGDILVLPVNQLKTGLQAGATDQVRWLNDSVTDAVRLRFAGETEDLPASMYTITPANPGPSDDLTITLDGTFPSQLSTTGTPKLLHIRAHVVYGAGRGLSRRPDSIHSIAYLNPSSTLLTAEREYPSNNRSAQVAWAPLWSKYRSAMFNGLLPSTTEMYADPGSKSVIVTPFRTIDFGAATPLTVDGNAANPVPTAKKTSSDGFTTGTNDTILQDTLSGSAPAVAGDALVITSGPGQGRYTIVNVPSGTTYQLDRPILAQATGSIPYEVYDAQGVMPLLAADGVTPKWTTTDPLGLFCGTTSTDVDTQNIYVSLPRHLVPGWGEMHVPIKNVDDSAFSKGINFLSNSQIGAPGSFADSDKNYVAYGTSTTFTYAAMSTLNLQTSTTATYNALFSYSGESYAGIRHFTDGRGLGREGLELPPFYGVARLFAVYEAQDYLTNGGSSVDPNTREEIGGGATNLLRQYLPQQDGPTLWVELDEDGDSTFILNANALDLSKAPSPPVDFASGDYVVECSIFGFDRGTFDLNQEARLVLTRPGSANPLVSPVDAWQSVGDGKDPNTDVRTDIVNKYVAAPDSILPGPATPTDQILVNYSRTPYQGDAWGSQTNYIDIAYAPGPLTTATAHEISTTDLDLENLERPNEKVLEVLAAVSFTTTLGTGRYAADASTDQLAFNDVAYEDPAVYPPATAIDDRPVVLPGNFDATDALDLGTDYLGATERLPLGALFRDKDFRGQGFNTSLPAGLMYSDAVGSGSSTGLPAPQQLEVNDLILNTATTSVGAPGDILVHVDGEQGNYSLLDNFRVTRGGSVFVASGPRPGGALSLRNYSVTPATDHVNVLQGRALLVRNTVTNVGSNEVSAGDELMLLVITSVQHGVTSGDLSTITIGTNGAGEGYAAADLYRIEGHPLVRDHVNMSVDPALIQISRKA